MKGFYFTSIQPVATYVNIEGGMATMSRIAGMKGFYFTSIHPVSTYVNIPGQGSDEERD